MKRYILFKSHSYYCQIDRKTKYNSGYWESIRTTLIKPIIENNYTMMEDGNISDISSEKLKAENYSIITQSDKPITLQTNPELII